MYNFVDVSKVLKESSPVVTWFKINKMCVKTNKFQTIMINKCIEITKKDMSSLKLKKE